MARTADQPNPIFAPILAALLSFAAAARGGHDLWAATTCHIAALAVGVIFLAARYANPGAKTVDSESLRPIAGAALAATLSLAGALHLFSAFHMWRDLICVLILFWVALHVFSSEAQLDRFLLWSLPIVVFECGAILHAQITGHFFIEQPPGTLVNSNVAAAFLLLWIPPLAHKVRITIKKPAPRKYAWLIGLIAACTGVLFTYSTWAHICLIFVFPVLLGWNRIWRPAKRHPRLFAGAALIALGLAGVLVFVKFSRTTGLDGKPLAPGENLRRFGWWLSGLRMFRDYPYLGVGIGNFTDSYLAYQAGAQHTRFAHSFLLTIAAETGLAGLGAFAYFVFYWFRRLALRELPPSRVPYLQAVLILLAYTSINFGLEFLAVLMAAGLIAAGAVAGGLKPSRKISFPILAGAAAAAVLAAPYVLAPFFAQRNNVLGKELLQSGNAPAALRSFNDASDLDPWSDEAKRGKARSLFANYKATGDRALLSAALREQEHAASLNPLSGVLRLELSGYLRELGDDGRADRELKEALRLDRGNKLILNAHRGTRRHEER